MNSNSLAMIENDLRNAALHRRYADVEPLAKRLCLAADTQARSLATGDPARAELVRRVVETLESARLLLCVARAATAGDLRRLPLLKRYLTASSASKDPFRLDI